MTKSEYYLKDKFPDFYPLCETELYSGWHFCPDHNFKLIGPGMVEMDFCECFTTLREVTE